MNNMVVTTFNSEEKAYKGLNSLKDLHKKGDITLYATAVITKQLDGKVVIKQRADEGPIGTSLGILTGALLGLAGGAAGAAVGVAAATGIGVSAGGLTGLIYDITEAGINADFLDEVSDLLLPGKTAVLAEMDEYSVTPVNAKIKRLGGTIFRIPRDEVVEDQLIVETIALNAELDEIEAEEKSARAETKQALKKTKESIKKRLSTIVKQTENRLDQIKKETEAKIKKLQSQIRTAKESQKAKIENRIAELKADQKERSEKLKKAKTLAKQSLTSKINNKKSAVKA